MVGEYVYTLDPAESFKNDKSDKQSDVRISELTAVGVDQLIVLERIAKTTKLHAIDLSAATNILGTDWDKAETSPSLEQIAAADLAAQRHHAGHQEAVAGQQHLSGAAGEGRRRRDRGRQASSSSSTTTISASKARRRRIVRLTMPDAAF